MNLISTIRRYEYWEIARIYDKYNYRFYTGPYNLNIFGIRKDNSIIGAFDDVIGIAYEDNKGQQVFLAQATTDPGKFYAENPTNQKGVAILVPGQYRGAYTIGVHAKNKPGSAHYALVQDRPVKVFRDRNKDNILDYDYSTVEEGMFGINIHRASKHQVLDDIGKWSAGCQVFRSVYDFEDFLKIAERGSQEYGNRFTYTLFTEEEFYY